MRDQGWAEGAGGIQRRVGERVAEEGIHGNREADAEAGNFVEGAFDVDHGGEEDEDEEEGHDAFEQHGVQAGEIEREGGIDGGHRFGTPRGIGDDGGDEVGGGDGAEDLHDPVEQGERGAEAFGDPETDGDGRIEMAAGDVGQRGDHDADGDSVGQREAEGGDGALAGGAQKFVGADRAHREKNYGEGADEFSEELLGQAVHSVSSRYQ